MISPSSDFHDKIKDPSTYPQNLVLRFSDCYLSANDGDIEESGVEFEEYFCVSEDLVYGECPSETMKATIINEGQILRTIKWGECRPYIGYRESIADAPNNYIQYETTDDPEAENYLRFLAGDRFYIETEGGGEVVNQNRCYSLLVLVGDSPVEDAGTCYAFGDGYAYKVDFTPSTGVYSNPTPIEPNRYMNTKMQSPRCVVWSHGNNSLWNCKFTSDGKVSEWVYCPMGVFYVEKPANLSGDIVQINEARDGMRLFDVDATDFLAQMQRNYPNGTSLDNWLNKIVDFVGASRGLVPSNYTNDSRLFKYTPSSASTLRQVLSYLAEACKANFIFSRTGVLVAFRVGDSMVEEVGIDRIEADTLAVADYIARPTTKLINKNLNGKTHTSGSGDNVYYILGNPFVPDNKYVSFSDFSFYAYNPLSCTVLEADPGVEVGDKVGIWLSADTYRLFIDNYNRVFSSSDNKMYGEEITAVETPLMHRILSWNGVCTATYEAVGNPTRLIPSEAEQTFYNSANNGINSNSNYDPNEDDVEQVISIGNIYGADEYGADYNHTEIDPLSIYNYEDYTATGDNYVSYRGFVGGSANSDPTFYVGYKRLDSSGNATYSSYIEISVNPGHAYINFHRNGVATVVLDEDGLRFYNTSGTLTKSYPAT